MEFQFNATMQHNWIFSVNSPPPPPHTIMDMRNNKRRNGLTHARVNFSQSETSSLLRGGELNFELLLWGGVNRKDPHNFTRLVQNNFHITGKLKFAHYRKYKFNPVTQFSFYIYCHWSSKAAHINMWDKNWWTFSFKLTFRWQACQLRLAAKSIKIWAYRFEIEQIYSRVRVFKA